MSVLSRIVLAAVCALAAIVMFVIAWSPESNPATGWFGAFCGAIALTCVLRGRAQSFFGSVVAATVVALGIWYLWIAVTTTQVNACGRRDPSTIGPIGFLLTFGLASLAYLARARFGLGKQPSDEDLGDFIGPIVEFKSQAFSPVLPEDCQVNPQVYGAELAQWLAKHLALRGFATSYPNSEDWGWFIEYSPADQTEFALHCVNINGARDEWALGLRRFARKTFGRDRPSFDDARGLISAIREILEGSAEVNSIQWHYAR